MHGPELFNDPQIVIFGKLLLATFLGAIIGTERAILAKQAAGTRTFSFVALGSCLFVVVSNFVNTQYLGIVNFDPTHLAAAVISGIGFIGAGLIIFRGDTVHGITTAAGLWIVAALGIAVGYGMYATALFTELLTLLIFVGVWYVEMRFKTWFGAQPDPGQTITKQ